MATSFVVAIDVILVLFFKIKLKKKVSLLLCNTVGTARSKVVVAIVVVVVVFFVF